MKNWLPTEYLKNGGTLKDKLKSKHQKGETIATKDSTNYYSKQLTKNIKDFHEEDSISKGPNSYKDFIAKKITQSKGNLERQGNKGKEGYDKYGKLIKKEKGGEMPKQGDTAAVYKKGAEMKSKYGKTKN